MQEFFVDLKQTRDKTQKTNAKTNNFFSAKRREK